MVSSPVLTEDVDQSVHLLGIADSSAGAMCLNVGYSVWIDFKIVIDLSDQSSLAFARGKPDSCKILPS